MRISIALMHENARKIKLLQLHTKRLLRGEVLGDGRSAIKGTGFEFDQIREYQLGDDIRFIDWNASARMNGLLVKEYYEQRSRIILLAVDVSNSSFFGSINQLKHDVIVQISGVLAMAAGYGNDRVGLLLFADEVECYIPPQQGSTHIRIIMEKLLHCQPRSKKTNFDSLFKKLAIIKKKNSIVFLLSDFIGTFTTSYFSLMCTMYDLVAIRCLDKNEHQLPNVGLVSIEDIETKSIMMLDTRKRSGRSVTNFLSARVADQDKEFKKHGVMVLDVSPTKPFIDDLIGVLKRRMRK